jgi:hypothetical protein
VPFVSSEAPVSQQEQQMQLPRVVTSPYDLLYDTGNLTLCQQLQRLQYSDMQTSRPIWVPTKLNPLNRFVFYCYHRGTIIIILMALQFFVRDCICLSAIKATRWITFLKRVLENASISIHEETKEEILPSGKCIVLFTYVICCYHYNCTCNRIREVQKAASTSGLRDLHWYICRMKFCMKTSEENMNF